MNKKLYDMMDWAEIEAVTYSEEDHPKSILGAHNKKRSGTLVQSYLPDTEKMWIKTEHMDDFVPMDMADEDGFYAILLKEKYPISYLLKALKSDGTTIIYRDPYSFEQIVDEKELQKFNAGIHYKAYEILGAHLMTCDDMKGVHFAVWAPNAIRVSVVGDFNNWDGRIHQMERLQDSGVFEIFIPGVKEDSLYKFEIKHRDGSVLMKSDPYAYTSELRPANASIVCNIKNYKWNDAKWMKERAKTDINGEPVFVYELHLGSFQKPEDGQPFYNYRELAPMVCDYVKKMGYTHIELMPVMEHPYDASWGYQVIGYYAPTSRYGSPEDFMYFMDYMHQNRIGVILDWVPGHFPMDENGLSDFDGTCLYEICNSIQGMHPEWGTRIFNYSRYEVANYLIANALFWVAVYHADGIRMDAVASMLYLDYGKNDGEWTPNMYGGKENLAAIEFLKHLNSVMKLQFPDVCMIAEESTAWPMVTGNVKEGSLGFLMKWNMGWMNDFLGYMSYTPMERTNHYGELCFSLVYAYSEHFMLTLSHDECVHGKSTMIGKMPGTMDEKFANLRATYGFFLTHPGKKLLFMGQDIAEFDEWNENRGVEWDLLQYPAHQEMQNYVKAMISFYKSHKALYSLDFTMDGFEWINNISANENIIVFLRKTKKDEDTLLVVCNFENVPRNHYKIGVPMPCELEEVFNSDAEEFGGFGFLNSKKKLSKKEECDDRENSVRIKVPPLGVTIFQVIPLKDDDTE